MLLKAPPGWDWFAGHTDPDVESDAPDTSNTDLAARFARMFAGDDGRMVLDHLESITLRRALPASASDNDLRHLEGQRQLVTYIAALVARGMRG